MELVQLITPNDLASKLGVEMCTLRKWKQEGKGPKYYKVGKFDRYHPDDVKEWLEKRAINTNQRGIYDPKIQRYPS